MAPDQPQHRRESDLLMILIILLMFSVVFLCGTCMSESVWGQSQACLESWGPRWAFQKTCNHPKHRLVIEHGIVVCRCEK